jgi:hypothetical protein
MLGTLVTIALLTAAASLVSRIFRPGLEARDELARLPFTPIGKARPGCICVRGRVRPLGQTLPGPRSGRAAVYRELVVTDLVPGFRRDILAVPFEIDDGTGRAVVSIPPAGPPVGEREPEVLSALPASHHPGGVERMIFVDDVITVGGQASWQIHPAGTQSGFRDAPTILVFEATRAQPLVLVSRFGFKA